MQGLTRVDDIKKKMTAEEEESLSRLTNEANRILDALRPALDEKVKSFVEKGEAPMDIYLHELVYLHFNKMNLNDAPFEIRRLVTQTAIDLLTSSGCVTFIHPRSNGDTIHVISVREDAWRRLCRTIADTDPLPSEVTLADIQQVMTLLRLPSEK